MYRVTKISQSSPALIGNKPLLELHNYRRRGQAQ